MRIFAAVRSKLKELYHALSKAAIEAILSRLQQIKMRNGTSIIKSTTRIDGLVNELHSEGPHVSALEKKQAFLSGLNDNFKIIVQTIRTSNTSYTDNVS